MFILLCIPCLAYGQMGYYRSVEGLKKAELKNALHDLIQPHQLLSYGGKGEGYTWAGFYACDRLEGEYVRDRYSLEQRRFNPDKSAVSNMNIEHIWANSWWGHLVNNAYCDLFNLYPSDATANGRKSNNPIGVVDGVVAYDNGVVKVGKSSSYRPDSLITVWEPADEWKGDFARTYFYMATCYQHMQDLWTTAEGQLTVDGSLWPTMRPWVYQLMLQWAKADPVDEVEQARNEAIYQIQGNRNPFVDYPQLCDYVWGDSMEYRFYLEPQSQEPELFVPAPGARIDYGLQALSLGFETTLALRGRNMPEGVDIAITGDAFAIGTTRISGNQLTEGFELPLSVHPSTPGAYQAILTIRNSQISQSDTLDISFVDGIPAYPATDIVCSASSRRFTAHWMDFQPGVTYTLEVYTKESNGSHKPYQTYTTMDHQYQVTGIQPSTTYYYTVSIIQNGELVASSNEIEVRMPEVSPVFSLSSYSIAFSTIPGKPSDAAQVAVTALSVPEYVTNVVLSAPFELSEDGQEWGQELILTGSNPIFLVRIGAVDVEGEYEGEMVVSTRGVDERIATLTASVDAQKAFFEDFETGSKGGYADALVTCTASAWRMTDVLLAGDDNRNGNKSVRMRNQGVLEMQSDKASGCDSLWFYAGLYNKDTGVKLSVYYSVSGGELWTPVAQDIPVGAWQRYGYALDVREDIRLRFVCNGTTNSKRINIDDVQMSDYRSVDAVEIMNNEENEMVRQDAFDLTGRRITDCHRGIQVRRGWKGWTR